MDQHQTTAALAIWQAVARNWQGVRTALLIAKEREGGALAVAVARYGLHDARTVQEVRRIVSGDIRRIPLGDNGKYLTRRRRCSGCKEWVYGGARICSKCRTYAQREDNRCVNCHEPMDRERPTRLYCSNACAYAARKAQKRTIAAGTMSL